MVSRYFLVVVAGRSKKGRVSFIYRVRKVRREFFLVVFSLNNATKICIVFNQNILKLKILVFHPGKNGIIKKMISRYSPLNASSCINIFVVQFIRLSISYMHCLKHYLASHH